MASRLSPESYLRAVASFKQQLAVMLVAEQSSVKVLCLGAINSGSAIPKAFLPRLILGFILKFVLTDGLMLANGAIDLLLLQLQ